MSIIKVQERKDIGINLEPMKKIEIIAAGEQEKTITSMLEEAKVTGFTLIRSISGKGHNGYSKRNSRHRNTKSCFRYWF